MIPASAATAERSRGRRSDLGKPRQHLAVDHGIRRCFLKVANHPRPPVRHGRKPSEAAVREAVAVSSSRIPKDAAEPALPAQFYDQSGYAVRKQKGTDQGRRVNAALSSMEGRASSTAAKISAPARVLGSRPRY